ILALGVGLVVGLHLTTGLKERRRDQAGLPKQRTGIEDEADEVWIDACAVEDIPNNRAKITCLAGRERIAVFRYDGKVSAVTNVCAHQRGPLGEGKIIDGCITCPWHGWEYRPHDGQSPPPFHERIATYQLRVVDGRVQVNPVALPPGTPV